MFLSSRIRILGVLLPVLLFLFACITPTSETTRFYVLNPLENKVAMLEPINRKIPLALEVDLLRLPQYLERPQIVTRSGKNRLELAEYHQWGGNLRKNMIRVIAKNLSMLLNTPNVSIAPNRSLSAPDFRVELEVIQFERDIDGLVRLTVRWQISRVKDRKLLAVKITDLVSPPVQTKPDLEQTVSAMSNLIGELSRIISRAIPAQNF